jgi:hypothetical protein
MVVFGAIYGWYVIAKTAMKLTPEPKDTSDDDDDVADSTKYLVLKKKVDKKQK